MNKKEMTQDEKLEQQSEAQLKFEQMINNFRKNIYKQLNIKK